MGDPARETIAVVGLGYVGLPLAVAFGRLPYAPVIGFDIDEALIDGLRARHDHTGELTVDELQASRVEYTTDPERLREATFVIITVPTPVTDAKVPDLSLVRSAARTVGAHLQAGAVVVLGLTFKPNVRDTRNSRVADVIARLRRFRIEVVGHDPFLTDAEVNDGFGLRNITELHRVEPVDGVIIATLHDAFRDLTPDAFRSMLRAPGVVVDVPAHFAASLAGVPGLGYRSL